MQLDPGKFPNGKGEILYKCRCILPLFGFVSSETRTGVLGGSVSGEATDSSHDETAIIVQEAVVDTTSQSTPEPVRPASSNYIEGSYRDDDLSGTPINDVFNGLRGNDRFEGGEGWDIARFFAIEDSFTITVSTQGLTVEDRRQDGFGTDVYSSVEELEFISPDYSERTGYVITDGLLSLDSSSIQEITELYIAYFGRAPDAQGLNYWADHFANGMPIAQIAANFSTSLEYRATFGGERSVERFVDTAYLNVLGRSSDPTGAAFWRSALESGGVSEEEFILQLLGGVSAGSPDRNYLDQKLDIGAYFSIIKGMSDSVDANAAMNLYDGSMGSIRAAISFIDEAYADATSAAGAEFIVQVVGAIDNPFSELAI